MSGHLKTFHLVLLLMSFIYVHFVSWHVCHNPQFFKPCQIVVPSGCSISLLILQQADERLQRARPTTVQACILYKYFFAFIHMLSVLPAYKSAYHMLAVPMEGKEAGRVPGMRVIGYCELPC